MGYNFEWEYNAKMQEPEHVPMLAPEGAYLAIKPSIYQLQTATLTINATLNSYRADLRRVAETEEVKKDALIYLAEYAVTDQLERFGMPEYFVTIDRRMWLIATPKDFKIINNRSGYRAH